MVEAIKTSVSSIEENDVEAVVEQLSQIFATEDDFKGDGAEVGGIPNGKRNEIKKSKKATEKDAVDDDEDLPTEEEESEKPTPVKKVKVKTESFEKESFYITSSCLLYTSPSPRD